MASTRGAWSRLPRRAHRGRWRSSRRASRWLPTSGRCWRASWRQGACASCRCARPKRGAGAWCRWWSRGAAGRWRCGGRSSTPPTCAWRCPPRRAPPTPWRRARCSCPRTACPRSPARTRCTWSLARARRASTRCSGSSGTVSRQRGCSGSCRATPGCSTAHTSSLGALFSEPPQSRQRWRPWKRKSRRPSWTALTRSSWPTKGSGFSCDWTSPAGLRPSVVQQ
mmetsp:Transcript_69177/g.223597  ORF Transcript_69177/g.223597 Transcript_69177/m.223597 type:complete len:224 (-) Transcript_69177:629-1300(-)